MADTLLLNANYLPLGVISWKRAFKHLCKDKAQVVTEYEDWQVPHTVPAIIRLTQTVEFDAKIGFSRDHVYIRDRYTCQYCSRRTFKRKELTFDHVIPKSRGGKTCFENIVTACMECNHKKSDRTPEEARMPLRKKPRRPPHLYYAMYQVAKNMSHPSWRDYTGIYKDLIDEIQ